MLISRSRAHPGAPRPWTRIALAAALFAAWSGAHPRAARAQADTASLPPQEIGTIAVGQTKNGVLEAGDWTMSDGTWADIWYVTVTAGQRVAIEARARGFSAYVQLLDPWGSKLAEDAGSPARVTYSVREAGRYQIVVNNYSDTPQPGSYVLTIR